MKIIFLLIHSYELYIHKSKYIYSNRIKNMIKKIILFGNLVGLILWSFGINYLVTYLVQLFGGIIW
jgi:hypothetical protein